MLALQGIGYLKRKAIAWATITLDVKEYVSDDGKTHIDIEQTATGGIKGTTEMRTLDWVERPHKDDTFGELVAQSHWIKSAAEAESGKGGPLDPWLGEGWLDEKVGPNGELNVHSWAVNEKGEWTGEQLWGFSEVEGVRYHTRRVIIAKGDTVLKVVLYYNWVAT